MSVGVLIRGHPVVRAIELLRDRLITLLLGISHLTFRNLVRWCAFLAQGFGRYAEWPRGERFPVLCRGFSEAVRGFRRVPIDVYLTQVGVSGVGWFPKDWTFCSKEKDIST